MKRTTFAALVLIGAVCLVVPACSWAQAAGSDMINQEMKDNGLFHPHINNCASSEVFVPVGAGGTGGPTGFCIDKDESSGSGIAWEDCRQNCASLGKRLPEPVEFKIACQLSPTGLINMTNGFEWASNFSILEYDSASGTQHMQVPVVGNGSCLYAGVGEFANASSAENTNIAYRCVHEYIFV
ncbi:MAG: hypothetical protein U0136_15180 [Bdellovibrionota bacterium]